MKDVTLVTVPLRSETSHNVLLKNHLALLPFLQPNRDGAIGIRRHRHGLAGEAKLGDFLTLRRTELVVAVGRGR